MDELFESPAPSFDPSDAAKLMHTHYGIDGTAKLLVSERDQNFRIDSHDGRRFVLKIANAVESPDVIEYENAIIRHIESVAPEFPVPRLICSSDNSPVVTVPGAIGTSHLVRVLSWLDGTLLRQVEVDKPLRRQLGIALAELGRALRGFFHPAASKPLLWDITQIASLSDKVKFVDDPALRKMCADFIAYLTESVISGLKALRAQVIHNDLNPSNVLVSEETLPRVTGVVDFGDTVHGPLICDVAVAAAYQLTGEEDPIVGVMEFVAAYHRVTPLEAREIDVLLDLITARAMTTVVVTSWRASIHPENRDYILRNADSASRNVRNLMSLDRTRTTDRIRRVCSDPIAGDPRLGRN
jgi:Ser/Thr protein kinase RdoA (MazF antagonist)